MGASARINELKKRHADLDALVEDAERAPSTDQIEITQLKKQKLKVKEEIHRLTSA